MQYKIPITITPISTKGKPMKKGGCYLSILSFGLGSKKICATNFGATINPKLTEKPKTSLMLLWKVNQINKN